MVSRQSLNNQLFLELKKKKKNNQTSKSFKIQKQGGHLCVAGERLKLCRESDRTSVGQGVGPERRGKRWMAPYKTGDWTCFIFISQ